MEERMWIELYFYSIHSLLLCLSAFLNNQSEGNIRRNFIFTITISLRFVCSKYSFPIRALQMIDGIAVLLFERQSKILHLYITLILWWYLIHLTTFLWIWCSVFASNTDKNENGEHRKITRRRIGIASRRGLFCEKNLSIYYIKILSDQIIIWRLR